MLRKAPSWITVRRVDATIASGLSSAAKKQRTVHKFLCQLSVRVQPNASKREGIEVSETELKVRVSAPPIDGRANEAVEELIEQAFRDGCASVEEARRADDFTIVAGSTSKDKKVQFDFESAVLTDADAVGCEIYAVFKRAAETQ